MLRFKIFHTDLAKHTVLEHQNRVNRYIKNFRVIEFISQQSFLEAGTYNTILVFVDNSPRDELQALIK